MVVLAAASLPGYAFRTCWVPAAPNSRGLAQPSMCPRPLPLSLRSASVTQAAGKGKSKGFGSVDKQSSEGRADANDDPTQARPASVKKRMRGISGPGPVPTSDQRQLQDLSLRNVEELEKSLQRAAEDEDFGKRLSVLRATGEVLKADIRAAAPAPGARSNIPGLDASPFGPSAGSRSRDAADAADAGPPVDIYANPPSLAKTLMGQFDNGITDPKLRDAKLGLGGVQLAAGAVIFGLIFLVSAFGDMAPGKTRSRGPTPSQAPPDPIEEGVLKSRAAALEEDLARSPNDPDLLEPLALTYAKLFRFADAADKIDRLLVQRPGDVDAWRVLGESSLLAGQPARSVAAFQKAAVLSAASLGGGPRGAPSLQVLTGLIDAYSAAGQYKEAEAYLKDLLAAPKGDAAPAATAAATAAAPASSPASAGATAALTSLPAPPVSAAAPVAAATAVIPPVTTVAGLAPPRAAKADEMTVRILLAKLYISWGSHDKQAEGGYDSLIKTFPEDYRGYLARGMYLKTQGRRAEAERMLLQAKYYAPDNRKAMIQSMGGSNPVLDLPDNN